MRVYDNGRIEEGQVRIKIYVFHFQSVSKLSIINSSLAFTMLTNYCLLICFPLKRAFYIKMSHKFPQNSSCEFANKCRYVVGCFLIITLAKKKFPSFAARKNNECHVLSRYFHDTLLPYGSEEKKMNER